LCFVAPSPLHEYLAPWCSAVAWTSKCFALPSAALPFRVQDVSCGFSALFFFFFFPGRAFFRSLLLVLIEAWNIAVVFLTRGLNSHRQSPPPCPTILFLPPPTPLPPILLFLIALSEFKSSSSAGPMRKTGTVASCLVHARNDPFSGLVSSALCNDFPSSRRRDHFSISPGYGR